MCDAAVRMVLLRDSAVPDLALPPVAVLEITDVPGLEEQLEPAAATVVVVVVTEAGEVPAVEVEAGEETLAAEIAGERRRMLGWTTSLSIGSGRMRR